MYFIPLQILACGGTPSTAPPETPAEPDVEEVDPHAAIVAKGPPVPSPHMRAILELAKILEVGTGRCGLSSYGLVPRIHGTVRDQLRAIGPKMYLDIKSDTVPWHVTYDQVPVFEDWVTMLLEPGATEAFVEVGDQAIRFTFPAAVAGETMDCTGAEALAPRILTGTAGTPREANMYAVGCTKAPIPVARDGNFVIEAQTPCTLWLEAEDGWRTNKVAVAHGVDQLTLDNLVFAEDTLQNPDRTWTDDGRAALEAAADKVDAEIAAHVTRMETVKASLGQDERAIESTEMWDREFKNWGLINTRLRRGLAGIAPL